MSSGGEPPHQVRSAETDIPDAEAKIDTISMIGTLCTGSRTNHTLETTDWYPIFCEMLRARSVVRRALSRATGSGPLAKPGSVCMNRGWLVRGWPAARFVATDQQTALRTHFGGDLAAEHVDTSVRLAGWVQVRGIATLLPLSPESAAIGVLSARRRSHTILLPVSRAPW